MALKFEHIIDIAANSISPADVHQTYIINEVKGDIVDYYRKDFNAAEKSQIYVDGPIDYSNINLNHHTERLARRRVSRIGVRSFPSIGGYGFYKDKNTGLSTIVCPINHIPIEHKAPTLKFSYSGSRCHFEIEPPPGSNYECYRIVFSNGNFSEEYITYETTYDCDAPGVVGTYEVYCIGYIEKEQKVSSKSNKFSYTVTSGSTAPGPGSTESYYTKQEIDAMIENIISRFTITASSINAENAPLCTFNRQYVACDTAFKLIMEYEYNAVEETIDRGRMTVLDMDFTEFANIDAITLSGYTPQSVLVRFDDPDVTWEQIGAMADAYYNDEITIDDVKQYWSVGDKRSADLSAMKATGVGESHRAQTVQFVIGDFEHDDLTEPINGHTKALITLLQKDCLMDASNASNPVNGGGNTENGYMNSYNTNVGGWKNCARRTWCNNVYYNALPSGLKSLIKTVNKLTSTGNQSTTINTASDNVFLQSEIEIFGSVTHSVAGEGIQYSYYKTISDRYKNPKWNSSYATNVWFGRSPYYGNTSYFCIVEHDGTAGKAHAIGDYGLAPCLCI